MAKIKPYLYSEDRLLQISNDISEDMCEATNKELIELVKYWRDKYDALWRESAIRQSDVVSALLTATNTVLKPMADQTVGKQNEQNRTRRSRSKATRK